MLEIIMVLTIIAIEYMQWYYAKDLKKQNEGLRRRCEELERTVFILTKNVSDGFDMTRKLRERVKQLEDVKVGGTFKGNFATGFNKQTKGE